MKFVAILSRHGQRHQFKHDTLEDAVEDVAISLHGDESWPVAIVDPQGVTLWEQSGPMTTSQSFEGFAKKAAQFPTRPAGAH